jgi:hypothetical protein
MIREARISGHAQKALSARMDKKHAEELKSETKLLIGYVL